MTANRRTVISLALLGAAGGASAQKTPLGAAPGPAALNPPLAGLPSAGVRLDKWSTAIRPHLNKLDTAQLGTLMKRNGAGDLDELSLQLAKRYPKLNPTEVAKKPDFKKYFNPLADAGTYEKGGGHDKEPYDKSAGYDRGGFSRT